MRDGNCSEKVRQPGSGTVDTLRVEGVETTGRGVLVNEKGKFIGDSFPVFLSATISMTEGDVRQRSFATNPSTTVSVVNLLQVQYFYLVSLEVWFGGSSRKSSPSRTGVTQKDDGLIRDTKTRYSTVVTKNRQGQSGLS